MSSGSVVTVVWESKSLVPRGGGSYQTWGRMVLLSDGSKRWMYHRKFAGGFYSPTVDKPKTSLQKEGFQFSEVFPQSKWDSWYPND